MSDRARPPVSPTQQADLVRRLRAAGCVFAEEEAAELVGAGRDGPHLEQLAQRRVAGEPLEQLVGHVRFGGLRLAVGPGVFVPRQRSLLLARTAARLARAEPDPVLLEAYAGVAPIASFVARAVPGLEVHVTDIDRTALDHARQNLPPGAGVHHGLLQDVAPAALRGRVTLLVAVPPYVPLAAAALLPREARDHEPARALYGGADGLDHVRELVTGARPWLAPGARLLVELHGDQYRAAAEHARAEGWTARRHDGADDRTTVLHLRRT